MSSAREEILGRIAAAHRLAPPPDLPYEGVTRTYRATAGAPDGDLVELLVDRLVDYQARVRRCDQAGLAATVAAALTEQRVRALVVPPGLPTDWLTGSAVDVRADLPDAPLGITDLDGADGVLTGCTVAVAETGTLVLDAAPDQGRRALTLVPDYHLCVVREADVVPGVPEALARLDPTRPLTMISGPSATSDIELNRVEGVHGPRTLEVIVVR